MHERLVEFIVATRTPQTVAIPLFTEVPHTAVRQAKISQSWNGSCGPAFSMWQLEGKPSKQLAHVALSGGSRHRMRSPFASAPTTPISKVRDLITIRIPGEDPARESTSAAQ